MLIPTEKSEERRLFISERFGFSITTGAFIHFIVTVVAITVAYASVRNDVLNVVAQSARNEAQLKITNEMLDRIRMDVVGITVKLDEFLRSYDRDMNKYIREDRDRR